MKKVPALFLALIAYVGIGDATFDKIRKDVALSGTTKVDTPAKAEPKKDEKKAADKKAAADKNAADAKK